MFFRKQCKYLKRESFKIMIVNKISVKTEKRDAFVNITSRIKNIIVSEKFQTGMCHIFIPHTTAGVTVNESADPDVVRDILNKLNMTIPWNGDYRHLEGNSAAHIKTLLTGSSLYIPVNNGSLLLGTWQGIYFCEFDGPRKRSAVISLFSC